MAREQSGEQPPPTVASLGLGQMGIRIAGRLCEAGFDVAAWNRTALPDERALAVGATIVERARDAVIGRDVVILALSDEVAVSETLHHHDVADALQPGSLVVDMSSIPVATSRANAVALGERGVDYLDAPVSGGVRGAEQGTLAIMVGGSTEAFERARPIFAVLGKATHVGSSGSGQLAKCTNQLIVAVTLAAVAEALLLAEIAGGDQVRIHDALLGGFADSRVLREHGSRMLEGNYEPGGRLALHIKDLRAVAEVAQEHHLELPFAAEALNLFVATADRFGKNLDHAAVALQVRHANAAAHSAKPVSAL